MSLSPLARVARVVVAATAAALAIPSAALALGAPDQQQSAQDGVVSMPPGIAQTFTVGRSGMLDGFAVASATSGTVVYQIYAVAPDGTPDVSRPKLPANGTAALLAGAPVDIAVTPFPVTAGERLALGFGTVRSYATLDLATASGDPYPAGDLFQVIAVGNYSPVAGVDLRFATYVSPYTTALALQTLKSTSGRPTAALTYGPAAAPLPGATVTFQLRRADQTVTGSCTAVTTTTGTATCAGVKWRVPNGGSLVATYAGDASYAPSTATVTG